MSKSHFLLERPDSAAMHVDTLTYAASRTGLVIERGDSPMAQTRTDEHFGESWVVLVLLAVFVAVCLRVKSNMRYLSALLSDLTDVRERQNVFDETVRETSLLVVLNVFWCCCAGVILYKCLILYAADFYPPTAGIAVFVESPSLCMGVCMGVAVVYTIFMTLAYLIVGTVFSSYSHARMWVKGFAAAQGLTSVLFFPIALGLICYPHAAGGLLLAAAIIFVLGKIAFIWKGLRIFFTQFSSWMLFLYYLCSLEVVPVVLMFLTAMVLLSMI